MQLLVIADDFTGALDTGVQFSQAGIATMVSVGVPADFAGAPPEAQALVVDTESRHLPPGEAAAAVGRLAALAAGAGLPYVYKKTDSTLRGNIGAELQAAMNTLGCPAMFVPAFPKAGRTTRGGRQFVDGVPLEQTAFARDPLNQTRASVVADILRAQADLAVRGARPGELPAASAWENVVCVFDGETDDDLARTARALQRAGRLRLTAGCAGFAAQLAALLPVERRRPEPPALPGRVLLVCGSVHEVSLRQMERAGALGYERLTPGAEALAAGDHWDSPAGREVVRRAAEALSRGGRLAVQSAAPGAKLLPADRSAAIAAGLGGFAAAILARSQPCALVVFGGDTAMAVMAAVGGAGLLPAEEIEPGVALSRMCSPLGDVALISKAGGLGSEDVLQKIEDYVRRDRS